jgi:hypothetical protein
MAGILPDLVRMRRSKSQSLAPEHMRAVLDDAELLLASGRQITRA